MFILISSHSSYSPAKNSSPSHQRTRASCMATVSACPMCREPVTLGGGMHMEKASPVAWGSLV